MRTITFLDRSGDTTISWDADVDDKMKEAIARLMKKGYSFLIVDATQKFKLITKISSPNQILNRSVVVEDEAMTELLSQNKLTVHKSPTMNHNTVKLAKTPEEVTNNNTVAVQPYRGG